MKTYNKEIIASSLFAIIAVGLLFWFTRYAPTAYLQIGIAVIIVALGVYALAHQVIAKKRALKDGTPSEDEFTKQAKLYASSRAFFYSLYLWFFIYLFNSSFTDPEEMLGFGLLGSSLIYGVSLWYYKRYGAFNA